MYCGRFGPMYSTGYQAQALGWAAAAGAIRSGSHRAGHGQQHGRASMQPAEARSSGPSGASVRPPMAAGVAERAPPGRGASLRAGGYVTAAFLRAGGYVTAAPLRVWWLRNRRAPSGVAVT